MTNSTLTTVLCLAALGLPTIGLAQKAREPAAAAETEAGEKALTPLNLQVPCKIVYVSANANGDASFLLADANGKEVRIRYQSYGPHPAIAYANPELHQVRMGSDEDIAIERILKWVEKELEQGEFPFSLIDARDAMRLYKNGVARLRKEAGIREDAGR